MEIEVGDYIRLKNGKIRKVKTIYSGKRQYSITEETLINNKFKLENITKHSKNIIDLIEEGDIINGFTVEEFDNDEGEYLGIPIYDDNLMDCIEEARPINTIDIKTILTHEQYEQNCFRLEN